MKTTINKVFLVEEPIEKVWANLSNPSEIVTCVPGASLTEIVDEKNFKGEVKMKFGPVKVKYNGSVSIEEMDDDNHKMMMKGKGLDSKGKGSADMLMNGILTEKEGGTEVNFTMDVSVVGKLAQFGARLIKEVSDHVLNEFVDNFKAKLAAQPNPESVESEVTPPIQEPTPSVSEKVKNEVKEKVSPIQEPINAEKSTQKIVEKKVSSAPPKKAPIANTTDTKEDSSLNAFSLIWNVIKGMFSNLFGKKN